MHREFLVKWLKDAYAMEKAAIELLEKQAGRLEHYPQLQSKVQDHLRQTEWQAEQVQGCLERLGERPSTIKNVMGKFMTNMAAMTNATANDEVIKDAIAGASFEHLEIASYRSLIGAAEECNEPEIRGACEQILQQEIDMARRLEDHLPVLTGEFLTREERSMEAKR